MESNSNFSLLEFKPIKKILEDNFKLSELDYACIRIGLAELFTSSLNRCLRPHKPRLSLKTLIKVYKPNIPSLLSSFIKSSNISLIVVYCINEEWISLPTRMSIESSLDNIVKSYFEDKICKY